MNILDKVPVLSVHVELYVSLTEWVQRIATSVIKVWFLVKGILASIANITT